MVEAAAGAYAIQRWSSGVRMLDRVPTIFRFVAMMAPTTATSATIGVTALYPPAGFASVDSLQHDLADLVDGRPLGRAARRPARSRVGRAASRCLRRRERGRAVLLFALVCLSAAITFGGAGPWPDHTPLAFLTRSRRWSGHRSVSGTGSRRSPLRQLRRLRPGERFAGRAPFATTSENTALLILATFIATLTATMLPMAAVVTERRRAEAERARLLANEHEARVSAEATSFGQGRFPRHARARAARSLSAIATAAHVLSADRSRDAAANHAQRVINRQVKHLARLVDDLLDVTRVTTGKVRLAREPVDVSALVVRCIDSLELVSDGERGDGPSLDAEVAPGCG